MLSLAQNQSLSLVVLCSHPSLFEFPWIWSKILRFISGYQPDTPTSNLSSPHNVQSNHFRQSDLADKPPMFITVSILKFLFDLIKKIWIFSAASTWYCCNARSNCKVWVYCPSWTITKSLMDQKWTHHCKLFGISNVLSQWCLPFNNTKNLPR